MAIGPVLEADITLKLDRVAKLIDEVLADIDPSSEEDRQEEGRLRVLYGQLLSAQILVLDAEKTYF